MADRRLLEEVELRPDPTAAPWYLADDSGRVLHVDLRYGGVNKACVL